MTLLIPRQGISLARLAANKISLWAFFTAVVVLLGLCGLSRQYARACPQIQLVSRTIVKIPNGEEGRNLRTAANSLHGAVVSPGRPVQVVADLLLPLRPVKGYIFAKGVPPAVTCLGAGAQQLLPPLAVVCQQAGLKTSWKELPAKSRLLLPFDRELVIETDDSAIYYFATMLRNKDVDVALWRQATSPQRKVPSGRDRPTDAIDCTHQAVPHVTIAFVGDIMLGRSVQRVLKQRGAEATLREVAGIISTVDVAIGNLEAPITAATQHTPLKKAWELSTRREYVFKTDPRVSAQALQELGIDVVSLANNHILDYRKTGLNDTFSNLAKIGIKYTGAGLQTPARKVATVQRNGLTVGLLSYVEATALPRPQNFVAAPDRPGVAMIHLDDNGPVGDTEKMVREDITQARQAADIVIVGLHWGKESSNHISRGQHKFARFCIDAGADMVWGHHPHVLQPIEIYKGKIIVYSLGNFIFPAPSINALLRTGILIVCHDTRGLVAACFVGCYTGDAQHGYGLPRLADKDLQLIPLIMPRVKYMIQN